MAKKRVEPFNPWPSFVDLFASVVMIVLMFMLVLIVNISYYSQFKYKISYTGTVAIKQEGVVKSTDVVKTTPTEVDLKKEKEKKVISAGLDYSNIESNSTRQENLIYEDWMVVKYLNSEVILDPQSIKDIESFLLSAKEKFANHFVSLYIKEPQNQVSASIAKQLALSRIINIRNLIRKLDYKRDDVVVRLKDKVPQSNIVDHESGYAVIIINRKR